MRAARVSERVKEVNGPRHCVKGSAGRVSNWDVTVNERTAVENERAAAECEKAATVSKRAVAGAKDEFTSILNGAGKPVRGQASLGGCRTGCPPTFCRIS